MRRMRHISFLLLMTVIAVFAVTKWVGFRASSTPFSCIREGKITFCSSKEAATFLTIPIHPSEYLGEAVADLVLKNRMERQPIVALVQSQEGQEYAILISKEGELSVSSVKELIKNSLISFDDGKGRGVAMNMPNSSSPAESVYFRVYR